MSDRSDAFRRSGRDRVRQLASESLYAFFRATFGVTEPGATFIDAKHSRVLARALEKVATGETKRLLIAIPPRHGKSLLGSVVFPCWLMGHDPALRIIAASYGDQLAKDFSLKSRLLLQSEIFSSIFPDMELHPNGQALDKLMTSAGGYRRSTSIGGVLTGMGADIAIVDDPIKASDAGSELVRNAAYEWFKTSLMSRFDKPAEARIVIIAQRLHQDDLIGRLKDDGGWTVLEMPSESWREEVYDLGDGQEWVFKPGDLLFPERFDHEVLKQVLHDLGEGPYSAQMLQRPMPAGGALFKLKHFQRYETLPPRFQIERIVQSWDPAFTDGETNAYTVCTTWFISGRKLYLVDVFRQRLEFPKLTPKILELRDKFRANQVVLEVSGIGKAIQQSLRHLQRDGRWLYCTEPTLGKVERATVQTPKIERGRVFLPVRADWLETFEAEILSFPHSRYADQVDSMVHFLYALDQRDILQELSAYENNPRQPF